MNCAKPCARSVLDPAAIVSERKEAYRNYEKMTPPRVITSEGEIITGKYRRDDLPADAIAGLPGFFRHCGGWGASVILNIEEADLEEGDILVTAFTDPELDAGVRHHQGPGHRSRRSDDARSGDRARIRPARRRRRGGRHQSGSRTATGLA